jgi:hypothetical protein
VWDLSEASTINSSHNKRPHQECCHSLRVCGSRVRRWVTPAHCSLGYDSKVQLVSLKLLPLQLLNLISAERISVTESFGPIEVCDDLDSLGRRGEFPCSFMEFYRSQAQIWDFSSRNFNCFEPTNQRNRSAHSERNNLHSSRSFLHLHKELEIRLKIFWISEFGRYKFNRTCNLKHLKHWSTTNIH